MGNDREKHREAQRRWREKNPDYRYAWYLANRESQLEYSREWRRTHQEQCDYLNQRRYQRHRDDIITQNALWARENPEKRRTRGIIYNNIKSGKMERPDICSLCGIDTEVQAHHEDYTKPLEVIWLCRSCHKRVHTRTLSLVH